MDPKEVAGRAAAELVQSGMTVGLGTGSTVHFTLARLGERIQRECLSIRGVPTSHDTERKARQLGIPLIALDEVCALDLTIDGADEIDPEFNMIKGGGGALLREKVIASISRREVIVAGPNKRVERLGRKFLLPIEVVPFARAVVWRVLVDLGCTPVLRVAEDGAPFRTDNHNEILDCRFPGGIEDPAGLERRLAAVPGLVESGLFVGLAHALFVCDERGHLEHHERRTPAS